MYRLAVVAIIDFFVSTLPNTQLMVPPGWAFTGTVALSAVGLYYVIKLAVKTALKESRE